MAVVVFLCVTVSALCCLYLFHILSELYGDQETRTIMRKRKKIVVWKDFLKMTHVQVTVDVSRGWPSKDIWVMPLGDTDNREWFHSHIEDARLIDEVPIRVKLAMRIESLLPQPLVESSSITYATYSIMDSCKV